MSADKHKNLAVRAGYLRLASAESGLALNIKWARKLTPFLKRMIDDGEIQLRRESAGGSKNVTVAYATPAGKARLDTILKRFGPEFGPVSVTGRAERNRMPKVMRRQRLISPEDRRAAARVVAAKRAKCLAQFKVSPND